MGAPVAGKDKVPVAISPGPLNINVTGTVLDAPSLFGEPGAAEMNLES